MIKSMTGYGKITKKYNNKTITSEVKSLNSKSLDPQVRLPQIYREKELSLRAILTNSIIRGRIDISVSIESSKASKRNKINKDLAKTYYKELSDTAATLKANKEGLFRIALQMPDVIKSEKDKLSEKEWQQILSVVNDSIKHLDKFRRDEGKTLEKELKTRINNITILLKKIEKEEPKRIKTIKKHLQDDIEGLIKKNKIDFNRLEQELIYYIEKIDFSEEKSRLKSHCNYFINTIKEKESNGKKLGFIAQEIGREINTLGSKANSAIIQQYVVQMKDELEKIKEQLLNVL